MSRISPQIPRAPKIAIVGEAPGETEERWGKPFVGTSGKLLKELMADAGIREADCLLTNVFLDRPPGNNIDEFLVPKTELPKDYTSPPVKAGLYVAPERLGELDRLYEELAVESITIVVALGNIALWALSGKRPAISKARGYLFWNERLGKKILPSYHPAGVMRQWSWRPVLVSDLELAARESAFPEIRIKNKVIHYNPTLEDVFRWTEWAEAAREVSIDLETARPNIITMFGMALSPNEAYVIPLCDRQGNGYWSPEDLPKVIGCIHRICQAPNTKVAQNALYEIQWLWQVLRTPLLGKIDDTMTMHHAIYQEMPKSLEFLGSIYSDIPHWKDMRKGKKDDKREA